jgi:hypothetical protein
MPKWIVTVRATCILTSTVEAADEDEARLALDKQQPGSYAVEDIDDEDLLSLHQQKED